MDGIEVKEESLDIEENLVGHVIAKDDILDMKIEVKTENFDDIDNKTDATDDSEVDVCFGFNDVTHMEVLQQPLESRCLICKNVFGSCFELLKHNLSHLRIKLIPCEEPDERKSSNLLYKCVVCGILLRYKSWHAHMRQKHSASMFTCSVCHYNFTSKRTYTRHSKYAHDPVKRAEKLKSGPSIKCAICNSVLSNPYCLTAHYRNVHTDEGKQFKCDICNSVLKSRSYLLTHMKRVHYNDGKVHKCDICEKKFKSPRYVNVHMKNAHLCSRKKTADRKKKVVDNYIEFETTVKQELFFESEDNFETKVREIPLHEF